MAQRKGLLALFGFELVPVGLFDKYKKAISILMDRAEIGTLTELYNQAQSSIVKISNQAQNEGNRLEKIIEESQLSLNKERAKEQQALTEIDLLNLLIE